MSGDEAAAFLLDAEDGPSGVRPESQNSRQSAQGFQVSGCSPTTPTLRANPFPEVTDLFCRLPLPTLFYRPEAVNLGDLLRLWVRPDEKFILSLGFSRAIRKAGNTTRGAVLYQTLNHISG